MSYAKVGLVFGGLLMFALVGFLYSREALFRVTAIEISGVEGELHSQVEQSLLPLHGRPLFSVALEDVQETLFDFARIQDVRIMRIWPSTLSLEVQERLAVAVEFDDGLLYEVDKFGHSFIELSTAKRLPLLSGLKNNPSLRAEVLRWLDLEREQLQAEADQSVEFSTRHVSELRWTESSGLVAELPIFRLSVNLPTRDLAEAWSQVRRARETLLSSGQIPHIMDAVRPDRVFIYQSSKLQKFETGIDLKELVRRVRDESPKAR